MPRKSSDFKKYNFYLPPKHVEAARYLATKRGLTTADVMRAALHKYVVAELVAEKHTPDIAELVDERPEQAQQ